MDLISSKLLRCACVIPTYNGVVELKRLIDSLEKQSIAIDILVVDSSSEDGTAELARDKGCILEVIPTYQFNHGGTRQYMVDRYRNYDVYVFMTQDAYLVDECSIERILNPFFDERVGAVCGRQLPHIDATPLARHARFFNYPPASRIKSMDDVTELGIKVPFISNSFAAYRREALVDAGGFPSHVILSEDMYLAARMLLKGWKVAYAGDACCRHSHNYTMLQEFRRYFDTGVFHAREPWIRRQFGGAGGEGFRYVINELKFLGFRYIYLWPSSLLRNVFKLFGFKLGLLESIIPVVIKRKLSMHKNFWG
jgi:rhamnosyltransferase